MVLEVATLLGGAAALWFFWDKIWEWVKPKFVSGERQPELEFRVERYNIGTVTADSWDGRNPSLFAQICIMNKGEKTHSITRVWVREEEGQDWQVHEIFSPNGAPLEIPINILPNTALFFCIRAASTKIFKEEPISVGRLRIEVHDHVGEKYHLSVTDKLTVI